MSEPSIPWSQWQDPRSLIAGLQQASERFAEQARQVNAAMVGAAAEVDHHGVRIRALGGRLEGIRIGPELTDTSPVQARDRVLEAWAEAVVSANRGGAAGLAAIADLPGGEAVVSGYRSSLPSGTEEAAERYDQEHPDAVPDPGTTKGADEGGHPMSREILDELLADDDADDEPTSVAALAKELDFDTERTPGDPSQWQANLEAEIAKISAAAADLPQLMEQIRGEAESKLVQIVVNAAGGLVDIRFRGPAMGKLEELNRDLDRVRVEAARDANSKLQEALSDRGWDAPADDPTMALLEAPDDTVDTDDDATR